VTVKRCFKCTLICILDLTWLLLVFENEKIVISSGALFNLNINLWDKYGETSNVLAKFRLLARAKVASDNTIRIEVFENFLISSLISHHLRECFV